MSTVSYTPCSEVPQVGLTWSLRVPQLTATNTNRGHTRAQTGNGAHSAHRNPGNPPGRQSAQGDAPREHTAHNTHAPPRTPARDPWVLDTLQR